MNESIHRRRRQKQKSHERILKAAAELFRKQGLDATGIDEIMVKAGLTAGAFYAHFKSKDHLIEEAVWSSVPSLMTRNAHEFLRAYLSAAHRDRPDRGCPLATLGSDLARSGRRLRSKSTERLKTVIAGAVTSPTSEQKRKAMANLSLAVGALILSRITQGTELSDEFLNCYR